ncbi:uncharacterized protein LOC110812360 isoform X2 [Carica papaya]|nr:uncharacterized protein LOC110812360 isoform X2 [Carica papaya]
MAAEPLTAEAIALTEKKMGMALDDIIKMSKNTSTKGKKQRRPPNKNQKFNAAKENALKVRRYMDSRSAVRQGALAKRRSNFQGNQFPFTKEVARKAAVAPFFVRASSGVRMAEFNKSRFGALPTQRRAASGGFAVKVPQQQENQSQQGNVAAKQRPQTLDSLFANMKEQRMRALSRQKNSNLQRNGGSRPRVPWARARFSN